MNKKNILCLLICFAFGMIPCLKAQTSTPPRNSQWEFASFGKNTDGKATFTEKEITMQTQNTRHAFFESDLFSYTYKKQSFPYDDCSRATVSVIIDQFPIGSAGIMMRTDEQLDSPNVHLEVSATGDLILFFRKSPGTSTIYRKIGQVSFPVEIRLTRQGDIFMSHYRNSANQWIKGVTAIVELGTQQMTGFYACSGNDSQIGYDIEDERKMQVTFRNWKMDYEENYTPAQANFVDNTPVKEGTLLRENFADGSLSNTPNSITNPLWKGIRYAELPYDKYRKRYWHKRGDGIYYLGDKKWADYEMTIEIAFGKTPPPTSEFTIQTRYQHISVYEKMLKYYGISLRNGNQLILEKYEANGNTVSILQQVTIPKYADTAKHTLKIKLLDKSYEVYWDGKQVMQGVDEKRPITYGNIGLKFTDVDMNIYHIEVIEVKDPINGNTDNYLMDYYDTPLPAYLEKYGYTTK